MSKFMEQFIRQTSLAQLSEAPIRRGEEQPPLELPWAEDAELLILPEFKKVEFPQADLREMIENRRSVRAYAMQRLRLDELSALLWLTQGIKRVSPRGATLRNVPSAGARHAFETFLLVNRVEGVPAGLYRYIASKHALLRVEIEGDPAVRMTEACAHQEHVLQSAVTFCWMAVSERMEFRYAERSMRYLHLDAGHVCQNLYLLAEAINCGVCAIAAYDDDLVNAALGVDGEEQFTIYIATLGKR